MSAAAAHPKTLYAPNPPQLDDPWLRALLVVLALCALLGLAALAS
jgi:hypothetical protein